MIVERKLNSNYVRFSSVKEGQCFEIPMAHDIFGAPEFDLVTDSLFIKTEPITEYDRQAAKYNIVNAIDLKNGMPMHIAMDCMVWVQKDAKVIIE